MWDWKSQVSICFSMGAGANIKWGQRYFGTPRGKPRFFVKRFFLHVEKKKYCCKSPHYVNKHPEEKVKFFSIFLRQLNRGLNFAALLYNCKRQENNRGGEFLKNFLFKKYPASFWWHFCVKWKIPLHTYFLIRAKNMRHIGIYFTWEFFEISISYTCALRKWFTSTLALLFEI